MGGQNCIFHLHHLCVSDNLPPRELFQFPCAQHVSGIPPSRDFVSHERKSAKNHLLVPLRMLAPLLSECPVRFDGPFPPCANEPLQSGNRPDEIRPAPLALFHQPCHKRLGLLPDGRLESRIRHADASGQIPQARSRWAHDHRDGPNDFLISRCLRWQIPAPAHGLPLP